MHTVSVPSPAHLQIGGLIVEFPTDVDVGSTGTHGPAPHQAAFNQLVRIVAHDLPVLAGAWLPLISVHHQILGPVKARRSVRLHRPTRTKPSTICHPCSTQGGFNHASSNSQFLSALPTCSLGLCLLAINDREPNAYSIFGQG